MIRVWILLYSFTQSKYCGLSIKDGSDCNGFAGARHCNNFNVLVCTTIIETGIDVPSANTIIINRADKLGLAQLYQLRGRVGRSHHRAYCYLIIPPVKQ
ncbi:hypothetical protein PN36_25625 [Candidatus Thiomargarita nelsonii]|uniref:Helicase C-terminal domain-containing protein n=1 Tax=Candidatus Thiomargarita nelsonii TaxID=1003181 RepID=A0A4E0RPP3_9GAMM|nr:hypothetical protein PN36_25625 [Candidatus Thiomargarita nelsonii]